MRLEKMVIANFRSIVEPLEIEFRSNYMTIVGPNNVGKSNVIRAIELFFRDTVDGMTFEASRDMASHVYEQPMRRAPTLITATVSLDPDNDVFILGKLQDLCHMFGVTPLDDHLIRIELNYYRKNTKRYVLYFEKRGVSSHTYIGEGIKKQSKDIKRNDEVKVFVDRVLGGFGLFHMPAMKNIGQIVDEWLIPEIKQVIFQGWAVGRKRAVLIADRRVAFNEIRSDLKQIIDESAEEIAGWMKIGFPELTDFNFEMPHDELEAFLGTLGIVITDYAETQITEKGAGLQNSSLIYLLYFIAKRFRPRNQFERKYFIWAMEEPESFLHSGKQREIVEELQKYSDVAQIIATTHSPLMLNRKDKDANILLKYQKLDDGVYTTAISDDINHRDLWKPYRDALGLSLADSLFFGTYNIVVEGTEDRYLLEEVNRLMQERGQHVTLDPVTTTIIPAGGASEIKKYLVLFRSVAEDGHIVGMFDNDGEGREQSRRLGDGFKEGVDYLLLGKLDDLDTEIEDLADPEVLYQIVNDYMDQGRPLSIGTETYLRTGRNRFKFDKHQKMTVAKEIMARSTYEQLERYRQLIIQLSGMLKAGQLPLPWIWQ